jgi:hypothetical protein
VILLPTGIKVEKIYGKRERYTEERQEKQQDCLSSKNRERKAVQIKTSDVPR